MQLKNRRQLRRSTLLARAKQGAERLARIRYELDEASARRAEHWLALAKGADEERSAEVEALSRRIEALRAEARELEVLIRSGPRELIIARARAEERVERELHRDRRRRRFGVGGRVDQAAAR